MRINNDFQVLSLHHIMLHLISCDFQFIDQKLPRLKRSPAVCNCQIPLRRHLIRLVVSLVSLVHFAGVFLAPQKISRHKTGVRFPWEDCCFVLLPKSTPPQIPELKKLQEMKKRFREESISMKTLRTSRYICIHFQMVRLRTSRLFLPLLPAPQQQIAGVCLGNEASWWEGVATIDDRVPNLLFSSFQSQALLFRTFSNLLLLIHAHQQKRKWEMDLCRQTEEEKSSRKHDSLGSSSSQ